MEDRIPPVLSISMLVSNNRRDTIEKCMESLVPLLKAVSSELIIVDTGCTDGSVDIARKYADKVVQFTWCKDFSAARNTGLRECTGEWFLYLDDDEWFEDVSEFIDFFHSGKDRKYDTVWYLQRNYDNIEGTSYTDTYVGRMVRLTSKTRFCGKIHEHLEPLPNSILKMNAYVHHYGYVFKCEEDKKKHAQRNIMLVEQEVEDNPEDIRMICQLVQEYRIVKRYEDALKMCNKVLEKKLFPMSNPFMQYLFLAVPRIYREQELYKKALKEFECLEKSGVMQPQMRPAFLHEKAATLVGLKREEELQQICVQYLKESNAKLWHQYSGEDLVMDLASFSSPFVHQMVAEYGIMSILRSGDTAYAQMFFDEIEWKENKYELVIALIRCYIDSADSELLRKYLPRVLGVEALKGIAYSTLDSMYEQYPEKREMISNDLEVIALTRQLKVMVRTQLAEGKTEEARAILSEMASMLPEDEEVKTLLCE